MDPRIQIGDIVYFTSSDGSKTVGLDDPTSFSVDHEKDYLEVKFTLKMLKSTDIQNFVNRCLFRICASKDKEGQQIRYDDKACFMLASSQELVTATQTPEDFMAFNKIELKSYSGDPKQQPYPKEFTWKFKPLLKHRKSGGYIYQNDKVSIETCMDSGGFLTPMSNRKLALGIKEYDFKVKCFQDVEELILQKTSLPEQIMIRALDPVTLFSVESQKYLGVRTGTEEKSLTDYVEKLLRESSHTVTLLDAGEKVSKEFYFKTNGINQQKIYKEKLNQIDQQSFNGLYRFELEDPLSNDFLQQGQQVRIRHIQTGKYITLIRQSDLEQKIKKDQENKMSTIYEEEGEEGVENENISKFYENIEEEEVKEEKEEQPNNQEQSKLSLLRSPMLRKIVSSEKFIKKREEQKDGQSQ